MDKLCDGSGLERYDGSVLTQTKEPLFEQLYKGDSQSTFLEAICPLNKTPEDSYDERRFQEACAIGCIETMDLLIKSGVDVNRSFPGLGEDYISPLLLAVENGNANIVKYLCSLPEIDKNATNVYGMTAVMVAAKNENSVCLEALIKGGCNVNVVDRSGNTALHHACYMLKRTNKATECLKILLRAGCDLNAQNCYGDTAVQVSQVRHHFQLVQYLISQNCIVNPNNFRDIPGFNELCSGKTYNVVRQGSIYHFNGVTWCYKGRQVDDDSENVTCHRVKPSIAFQTLKDACRFQIRSLLGTKIGEKVDELGVPRLIKEFILLKDVLPDNCFS